jgi:hypothetical protein
LIPIFPLYITSLLIANSITIHGSIELAITLLAAIDAVEAVVAVQTLTVFGIGRANAFACHIIAISCRTIALTAVRESEITSLATVALTSDYVIATVAFTSECAADFNRFFFGALWVAVAWQCAVVVLYR